MTDIGDGHFDERVASSYDDDENPMFDPAVIEPTIDVSVREKLAV